MKLIKFNLQLYTLKIEWEDVFFQNNCSIMYIKRKVARLTMFLRFMTGLGIGYFVVCKVLIIESVKINYRHLFLGILWGLFAVGQFYRGKIVLLICTKDFLFYMVSVIF